MELLPKYLNDAHDANKMKRCSAYKKLNELVSTQAAELDAQTAFSIIRQCLKGFEDTSERCREESVRITASLLTTQESSVLDWVLPAIVTRIGVSPVAEDSEEIRLLLLQLASHCLAAFPHDIGPRNYIDFFQVLLENCLQDPFPDLKKEACRVTAQLCAIEPKQVKVISVALAKTLKTYCLLHRHSAVRSEAVRVFATLLLCGASEVLAPSKDEPESRTTPSQLFILANDHSNTVRQAVTEVLCCALVEVNERLEHHSRYLPHLLLLATDAFDGVRKGAIEVLIKVGKLYMIDNEDNRIDIASRRISMKDIAWYGDDDYPKMTFSPETIGRYPILLTRPPLGVRYAVAEACRTFLSKLLSDVSAIEWVIPFSTNNRKTVALRILWTTIYHCEKSTVQFAESVLGSLYTVLRDDADDVKREGTLCMEVLSKFLTPEQYLPFLTARPTATENEEDSTIVQKSGAKTIILTPADEGARPAQRVPTLFSTAAISTKCSILVALKYLVEGSKESITGAHAMQIVQAATSPDILESDNEQLLLALLSALSGVFTVFAERGFIATPAQPLPEEVRADVKQRTIDSILLYALLRVKSTEFPTVSGKASACIADLSVLVTGSTDGIYDLHTKRLLVRYGSTMPVGAFSDLLSHATPGDDVDSLLKTIFVARLSELNFSMRVTDELRYFSVLEQVLWAQRVMFSTDDLEELLRLIIIPLGAFQPGSVAHLFRKVAINCLCALMAELYRSALAPVLARDDMALSTRVLTLWASASDSEDGEMRLMCMTALPDACKLQMSTGLASEMVQSILLRFDDSSDLIRLRVISGLLMVIRSNTEVSPHIFSEIKAQMVPIMKKVLVYMDDEEDTVGARPVLLEVAKALGDVSPNIVVDLIQAAMPNHHDRTHAEEAIAYIKARH